MKKTAKRTSVRARFMKTPAVRMVARTGMLRPARLLGSSRVFLAGELDVTTDWDGVQAVSGLAAYYGGYTGWEAEGELFNPNSEKPRSDEVAKFVNDDQDADDYEEEDDRGHRAMALTRGQVPGPAVGGEDIFVRGFEHGLVAVQDSLDDMEDVVETDASV